MVSGKKRGISRTGKRAWNIPPVRDRRVLGLSSPKLLPSALHYLHVEGTIAERVTQAVSDRLRTRRPGLSSIFSNWCCTSALPQYFSEYTSHV